MLKKLVVIVNLLFSASISSSAQGLKIGSVALTGEVEFTQDQKGNQTYDLYIFGHAPKIEFLGRATNVENSIRRVELSIGKSFALFPNQDKKPRVIIIPYAGLTTDGAVFTPVIFVANFWGRDSSYIPDPKFFYNGKANTLYQEASISLTKSSSWQFRWERLNVTRYGTVFNRFGIERRIWVRNKITGKNSHFHISPFVDTTNKQLGFYSGFRWQ